MKGQILYVAKTIAFILRAFNTQAEALTYCEWYNANVDEVFGTAKVEPVVYLDRKEDERVISDSVRELLTGCGMSV